MYLNLDSALEAYIINMRLAIKKHEKFANAYARYNKYLEFPIMLLSACLTVLLGVRANYNYDDITKYVELMLASCILILSTCKDFFKLKDKANSHVSTSKLLKHLARTVETKLMNIDIDRDTKLILYKDLISQLTIIEEYEESTGIIQDIPEVEINRYCDELGKKNKSITVCKNDSVKVSSPAQQLRRFNNMNLKTAEEIELKNILESSLYTLPELAIVHEEQKNSHESSHTRPSPIQFKPKLPANQTPK